MTHKRTQEVHNQRRIPTKTIVVHFVLHTVAWVFHHPRVFLILCRPCRVFHHPRVPPIFCPVFHHPRVPPILRRVFHDPHVSTTVCHVFVLSYSIRTMHSVLFPSYFRFSQLSLQSRCYLSKLILYDSILEFVQQFENTRAS